MYNLYLISKKSKILNFKMRGIYLSKNFLKKNKKQVMVFLRAPKHFNIGKHKIFSFKNKYTKFMSINSDNPTINIIKYPQYLYRIIIDLYKFQFLFHINSIKITTKTSIKWNKLIKTK